MIQASPCSTTATESLFVVSLFSFLSTMTIWYKRHLLTAESKSLFVGENVSHMICLQSSQFNMDIRESINMDIRESKQPAHSWWFACCSVPRRLHLLRCEGPSWLLVPGSNYIQMRQSKTHFYCATKSHRGYSFQGLTIFKWDSPRPISTALRRAIVATRSRV